MSKNIEKLILEDIKKSNNVSYSALDKAMARMDEKIAEQQANKKFNLRFLYILSPIVAACILIAILIPILINNNHRGYNDLVDGTFSYSELTKEEIVSIEEYNKEYNTDYLYFDEYEIIESNKLVRKENILMIEEKYQLEEVVVNFCIISSKSVFLDYDKLDFFNKITIDENMYFYYCFEEYILIKYKIQDYTYYISINTVDLDIVKEILSNL